MRLAISLAGRESSGSEVQPFIVQYSGMIHLLMQLNINVILVF